MTATTTTTTMTKRQAKRQANRASWRKPLSLREIAALTLLDNLAFIVALGLATWHAFGPFLLGPHATLW